MENVFITDVGLQREHNEDNGGIFTSKDNDALLAVVADGMGGHKAGDVASDMATKEMASAWEVYQNETVEDAAFWLKSAIIDANRKIFERSISDSDCQGMGTTITAAICTEEEIIVGHVGDSRAYLLSDHAFIQQTEDHSLVNELVKNGQISSEEAENHPRKNVLTRALGTEESIVVDMYRFQWRKGDVLVLCSDGLTNMVEKQVIEDVLLEQFSLKQMAELLVHKANEKGGEDNITFAAVRNDRCCR